MEAMALAQVVYSPGTPVSPTSAHWIVNNMAYAESVNNPYPGSSRSLLHGQSYSDLDLTVVKTFPITERVGVQLSMAAYNALNQMYRGSGEPFIGASNFTSNQENTSGTVPGKPFRQSICDSRAGRLFSTEATTPKRID